MHFGNVFDLYGDKFPDTIFWSIYRQHTCSKTLLAGKTSSATSLGGCSHVRDNFRMLKP